MSTITPGRAIVLYVLLAFCVPACFTDPPPETGRTLVGGRVLMAPGAGLAGAKISIDQLETYADNGHKPGDVRLHVGDVVTDDQGYFEAIRGPRYGGLIAVRVSGGTFRDPISGARIQRDPSAEVRGVYYLDVYEDRSVGLYITPVHSMVEARYRYKMSLLPTPRPMEAFADAYSHINAHLGGLDWSRVVPADVTQPAISPTDEVRAAFVLGGLAVLADNIRAASDATPQAVNLSTVLRAAEEDLKDALLDGNDGDDVAAGTGLEIGECPSPAASCTRQSGCQLGACRPLCSVWSNTWRASWSQATAAYIGTRAFPSVWNQTTLGSEDARPLLDRMGRNQDPDLFGDACVDTLDRLAPAIGWIAPIDDVTFLAGERVLSISASDDSGIARAYFPDRADEDGDLTNNVARTTVQTTTLSDGPLVIVAAAIDQAGNERRISRTFEVDNTAPALTLDGSDFYRDARAWWTQSASATLRGSLTDANPKAVTLTVQGATLEANLNGSAWSADLPVNVITREGTAIVIHAEDLAGNVTTLNQVFRLDTDAPVFTALPTTVRDERSDTIGFVGVTPNHSHDGPPVTLGGAGCPDVYKYAYLLDEAPPPFGGEIGSRNPLVWSLELADPGVGIDPATTQYRVHVAGGAVLLDWSPAVGADSADGAQRFDLPLYRAGTRGIAALGSAEGPLEIELRGRDYFGHETTGVRCWTHHPLAAPLHLGNAYTPGSGGHPTHAKSLNAHGLENTRIQDLSSLLLNDNSVGASTMDAIVSNGTAEVVYLRVQLTAPATASGSRAFTVAYRAGTTQVTDLDCDANPEDCTFVPGNVSVPESFSAMPTPFEVRLFAADAAGVPLAELASCADPGCMNTPLVRTYRLPARTSITDVPRFVLSAWLKQAVALRPSGGAHIVPPPFAEFALGLTTYTGKLSNVTYCSRTAERGIPRVTYCTERTTFAKRQSVDSATISIPQLVFSASWSPTPENLYSPAIPIVGPQALYATSE
ncbi:MAG: hypothetical protein R3B48_18515 [Kofleriaceae bacterium]